MYGPVVLDGLQAARCWCRHGIVASEGCSGRSGGKEERDRVRKIIVAVTRVAQRNYCEHKFPAGDTLVVDEFFFSECQEQQRQQIREIQETSIYEIWKSQPTPFRSVHISGHIRRDRIVHKERQQQGQVNTERRRRRGLSIHGIEKALPLTSSSKIIRSMIYYMIGESDRWRSKRGQAHRERCRP